MPVLSQFEKRPPANITSLAVPETKARSMEFKPEALISLQDRADILRQIHTSMNQDDVQYGLGIADSLATLFPELKEMIPIDRRKVLDEVDKYRVIYSQEPERLGVNEIRLLARARTFFPDVIDNIFTFNPGILHEQEKYIEDKAERKYSLLALERLAPLTKAFGAAIPASREQWFKDLILTEYFEYRKKRNMLSAAGITDSDRLMADVFVLRIYQPEFRGFVPTPDELEMALNSIRLHDPGMDQLLGQTFTLAMMCAQEIILTNRGVHIVPAESLEEATKIQTPPSQRNF